MPKLGRKWGFLSFPDANGWADADYRALLKEGNKGSFRPEHWLCVSASESGLSTKAFNPHGGARGLTQMMPQTLKNLGWHIGDLDFDTCQGEYRELPVEGQIRWSGKYFEDCRRWTKTRSWNSPGDLYLANFLPARLIYKDQADYVLAATPEINYVQNIGFDHAKKGWVNVQDVRDQAQKGTLTSAYKVAVKSLTAVRQARLNECLGSLEPLVEDGLAGPATQAHVDAFRVAAGLPEGGMNAALDQALFGV